MNLLEFFFIGVGLSMDAFAVSICKGLKESNRLKAKLYYSFLLWSISAYDAFNRIRFKCKFC